jgi:AcrR family transcriptional regulator
MARRAAGKHEKDARRREILARADSLFAEKSFDEIKMAELASSLGIAKGTLYLYFPSKESLFLALLRDRLDAVLGGFVEALDRSEAALSAEGLATGVASSIAADLALPRLLAELHPVLERKLPFEEAIAFKRELALLLGKSGEAIARALPPLSPAEGLRFILYIYALVVGLASLTDLSPFMKRVGAQPGLELFRLGFEEALGDSARATLAGLVEAARARERGEGGSR